MPNLFLTSPKAMSSPSTSALHWASAHKIACQSPLSWHWHGFDSILRSRYGPRRSDALKNLSGSLCFDITRHCVRDWCCRKTAPSLSSPIDPLPKASIARAR